MIAYNKHQRTIHFHYIVEIEMIIVIINSYQCAMISEMTLNISLHGSHYNMIQRHFLP